MRRRWAGLGLLVSVSGRGVVDDVAEHEDEVGPLALHARDDPADARAVDVQAAGVHVADQRDAQPVERAGPARQAQVVAAHDQPPRLDHQRPATVPRPPRQSRRRPPSPSRPCGMTAGFVPRVVG
jgi:hypothetical protein